jgi:hypothetical protein
MRGHFRYVAVKKLDNKSEFYSEMAALKHTIRYFVHDHFIRLLASFIVENPTPSTAFSSPTPNTTSKSTSRSTTVLK